MSLETPEQIRRLQRKLYAKAKQEPSCRFHQLYDKIYRADILSHAWKLSRSKGHAPGVDGVRFAEIESRGVEEWLAGLKEDLHAKTYRPEPVRRVLIPKPGGGTRPLGIPTIRDRVVQTAAKLVLEPIFEADFEDCAFGYRPRRSARQAIERVHRLICRGYTDVVDADLSEYFDSIPHDELMSLVARRVVDRWMLKLVKSWLRVPIEESDEDGNRRLRGGRRRGTPQGGVISPLLANIYMHRFLSAWLREQGRFAAHIVNYADDFVILSRGHAEQALTWTRTTMTSLGLTLSEAKTTIRRARQESFDFLGYTFGPEIYRGDGHWYLAAKPSRPSLARIKGKVGAILRPSNVGSWSDVRGQLNGLLRGWANYYGYGTRLMAYRTLDNYVYQGVRRFLRRRHQVKSCCTKRFSTEVVYGRLGVLRLRALHLGPPA